MKLKFKKSTKAILNKLFLVDFLQMCAGNLFLMAVATASFFTLVFCDFRSAFLLNRCHEYSTPYCKKQLK